MEVPVRVVTRVRPPNASEQADGTCVQVAPASSQVILGYDHFVDLDAVFGQDVSQKDLYSSCLADLVVNFFQGYNVTVMGYGQRGSGKTHTLTGPDFLWAMNEEEFGLLPQAVRHVFTLMRECPGREYRVHVSYLAVQRDAVYDLLSTSNSYMQLNVLEDNMGNVVIPGLNVVDCSNITEVFNCLEAGLVHRHTAALQSHDPSSSHAIFSLILEHQWTDPDGKLKYLYSRMSFVDLGGSERLMQSGYGEFGLRSEDSFFINSDLKALGNVINCLTDQNYVGQIPYRESRLTHILKDAFGGNSLCLMVCCLSPSPKNFDATFNTLKYGALARYILNCPAVNMAIQNSARGSTATASTVSLATQPQSGSRQSMLTGIQSSMQQSLGTNETSVTGLDETASVDNEDIFKLQFAASQWQLLVSSADELLSEFLKSPSISPTEKTQIETWLCMKAEAEECIGTDLGTLRFNSSTNRVLDVIEELSEPEVNNVSSTTEEPDSDSDMSSMSSLGEEFYDQLAVLRGQFRTLANDVVERVQDSCDTYSNVKMSSERRKLQIPKIDSEIDSEIVGRKSPGLSRKSSEILSPKRGLQTSPRKTSDSVSGVNGVGRIVSQLSSKVQEHNQMNMDDTVIDASQSLKSSMSVSESDGEEGTRDPSPCNVSRVSLDSNVSRENIHADINGDHESTGVKLVAEVKRLSASQESRKGKIRWMSVELRSAQQRLKELNETIRLKEAFIRELLRKKGEAEATKKKCQSKKERLEKELNRARQRYQEAQNQLTDLHDGESADIRKLRSHIDQLKKDITHYQNKISTIEKVSLISQQGDSKVSELETSVRKMRKQQDELQERLKTETQRKEELEQNLFRDKRRIANLETRMKDDADSENDRGWLAEEEERILKMREATQHLQQEVKLRDEAVKHRELMLKEKMRLQSSRTIEDVNGDMSDNIMERKESDLREEISNLRTAKDSLMVRRQKLDKRIHRSRGKGVGTSEERHLLELDEIIEAVDAAIEYKNEVICGRARELKTTAKLLSQDNLLDRLVNLSSEEMRSLLVKYFNKVIDIRIEFRKQEIAFTDLEAQCDERSRKIRDMKAVYEQVSLEMERRITYQQRDYQQKISTLLKQFNDDSSGSGAHEFRLRELETQLFYYKKLSRDLKAQIRQDSEELRGERSREDQLGPSHQPIPRSSVHPEMIPSGRRRPLLPSRPTAPILPKRTRLQAAEQAAKHPSPQTKVTREKNKIIIQQKSDRSERPGKKIQRTLDS